MRFLIAAVCFLAVCCFQGCTSGDVLKVNVEKSAKLRGGMSKAEVLKLMGEPLKDERFCKPDIWYYHIRQVWADGLITEDECLPLVFRNGKLLGWGHPFLAGYRINSREKTQKITLPVENKK